MTIRTLVLVAISTLGLAGNAQMVKTANMIPPGKCGPSFMLRMFVLQKLNDKAYLVLQNLGPGTVRLGIVNTKRKLGPKERVNIPLAYVSSGPVETEDGFEKTADLWRECEIKPKEPSADDLLKAAIDEAKAKE